MKQLHRAFQSTGTAPMTKKVSKLQWVCCNRLESHPLTQSHHIPPFQKPNTRERPAPSETSNSSAECAPRQALHAISMRTGSARVFVQVQLRRRRRLRACITTSMEQETARVLPERGRADGKNEEDEEQRRRRAGGCRAFSSSPASALYITEQGSRGSGRYGG